MLSRFIILQNINYCVQLLVRESQDFIVRCVRERSVAVEEGTKLGLSHFFFVFLFFVFFKKKKNALLEWCIRY